MLSDSAGGIISLIHSAGEDKRKRCDRGGRFRPRPHSLLFAGRACYAGTYAWTGKLRRAARGIRTVWRETYYSSFQSS
jgi:hypothetical protein